MRNSLKPRQPTSNSPCPGGDGSEVGSHCGVDLPSNDLLPTPTTAADLSSCVDICATHRPQCLAVAFEPVTKQCALKSTIGTLTKQTYSIDVAIAAQTAAPSSDCSSLSGGQYTSGGVTFGLQCGHGYRQDNIIRIRQETFGGCIGACIDSNGCMAIAFNNVNGYENCYLKSCSSGKFTTDPQVDAAYLISTTPSKSSGAVSSSLTASSPSTAPSTSRS